MMPLPALLLVKRVPAIVWIILGVAAALAIALASAVRYGEERVVRVARRDSVVQAAAAVTVAQQHADGTVAVAKANRALSDSGHVAVRRLEASALPVLETAPPAVQLLVAAQSVALARDSVTMSSAFVAIDSLIRERAARVALDTLRVHAQDDKPPDSGHRRIVDVAIGVGFGVAAVASLLHFAH